MGRPTQLQRDLFRKVLAGWRVNQRYYCAETHGERVTLASLWRLGALHRQTRRGEDGDADAAYEYRPSDTILAELSKLSKIWRAP